MNSNELEVYNGRHRAETPREVEVYLGKLQESGFHAYLRNCLSGLPYFMQSNSPSMKGQLEES